MTAEPASLTTPSLTRDQQLALYRRALRTLPGGTNSNFRAWGDATIYVDRGKGGHVWTVPVPSWVKAAVDDWLNAAEVNAGPVFRAINKASELGRVHSARRLSGVW